LNQATRELPVSPPVSGTRPRPRFRSSSSDITANRLAVTAQRGALTAAAGKRMFWSHKSATELDQTDVGAAFSFISDLGWEGPSLPGARVSLSSTTPDQLFARAPANVTGPRRVGRKGDMRRFRSRRRPKRGFLVCAFNANLRERKATARTAAKAAAPLLLIRTPMRESPVSRASTAVGSASSVRSATSASILLPRSALGALACALA